MNYPMEMPDEKLIQFYLCNNPAALAALTELYKDRIYNTIYITTKDTDAAEQIFREVFICVINNLMAGKNADNGNFLQWTIQLARQLCIEYNYKTNSIGLPGNICNDFNDQRELYNSASFKSVHESHKKIRQMINMLPDVQRETIILNHYGGLSFREIADKMKCSVTGALDTMKCALTNLQKLMTEQQMMLG